MTNFEEARAAQWIEGYLDVIWEFFVGSGRRTGAGGLARNSSPIAIEFEMAPKEKGQRSE